MMWGTIANLKENLSKIALDVHDEDDEVYRIYDSRNPDGNFVSDRRNSHHFAHYSPASHSPLANGFDSAYKSEMEQYKTEIKKLQESEAEIKALSINYAALLKEKEDQMLRLHEENQALKQKLDATNATSTASRNESVTTSTDSLNGLKGSSDQSLIRQHKGMVKSRSIGNQTPNGFASKQGGLSNGITQPLQPDVGQSKMELRSSSAQGREKELADLLEEKNRSVAAIQAAHESQMKKLGLELEEEREKLANMQLRMEEEEKLTVFLQEELNSLKMDKDKTLMEMKKIRQELSDKIIEVQQLQMEVNRKEDAEAEIRLEDLRREIATLKKENNGLKSVASLAQKEEMDLSLQKMEKDLKKARQQKDKALQELNRLKQHLLEKESEESEKMDEDSKIIEELREKNEYQRLQISHWEKALKQAMATQEEAKISNTKDLQDYRETIDDLKQKLANCMSIIDSKNIELLNLQTALGQYYAEIEAKERLEGELTQAREDLAELSGLLENAHQQAEISNKEKKDILDRLSQAEMMLVDGRNRVNKLEEDNGKLRRALEQSMSRINRMSMDSDYYVDRRIVIKLLVTYFQRNHSKEVLDLMVRMLGFSDEDKQRIGVAQQGAGKGVVRGVLGLPGRLVGGILGGNSAEALANMASENQSFADLWVDFLLKETEKRERRESAEAAGGSIGDPRGSQTNDSVAASPPDQKASGAAFGSSRVTQSFNRIPSPFLLRGSMPQSEHDSEFSTVPLTSECRPEVSRLHFR